MPGWLWFVIGGVTGGLLVFIAVYWYFAKGFRW